MLGEDSNGTGVPVHPDALARLQRAIREGIEQLDRGESIPASKVIEDLRRRHG